MRDRENARWVNQYAYDVTWQGRRQRVYIKRLKPIVLSDKLISDSAVNVGAWFRKRLKASL